jgi:tetratricopeptide (TPR) repeat protein
VRPHSPETNAACPLHDVLCQARQAAQRSIELEPRDSVGHRVLGEISLYFDRDWQLAGNRLERSVELAPSAAAGHHSYAAWLSSRGRHDEALREIELAEALDPGSDAISIDAMMLRFYARDFDGTIRAARRLEQLWPDSKSSHQYTVLSHLAMGDIAQAAAKARTVLARSNTTLADSRPEMALTDSEALEAYWMHGLEVVRRYVQQDDVDPSFLSIHYIQLGQSDAAIDALETAVKDNRISYLLPYLGVSPAFDSLCGYPRFERILRDLRQSALNSESVESRCAAAIKAAASSPLGAGP